MKMIIIIMLNTKTLPTIFHVQLGFQGSQEEWQNVFFLAAGVNVIGAIAFLTCSDLQPWARGNQYEITIEVDESKELQNIKNLDGNVEERKSDEFGDSEEITTLTSDM
jgi:hypothetical protein